MTLSLSDFRNNIKDLARPNRFEVEIHSPSYIGADQTLRRFLTWTVETAQIPSRTQGEIPIKFHGMELKLPGDYAKENLNIGFINSYGWEGRDFFENWMEYIQLTTVDNRKANAMDMITDSRIYINQLGRVQDSVIASYIFHNAFPTNISAIELNQNEMDTIEKFTVSFAYSHFERAEAYKK